MRECKLCNGRVSEPCVEMDGRVVRDASRCETLSARPRGDHGRPITTQTGVFEECDLIFGTIERQIDVDVLRRYAPEFQTAISAAA